MEKEHQLTLLDDMGGEPLEGSGFESEQPLIEDELVLIVSPDQRKGDKS